jgi:hypothetical protein
MKQNLARTLCLLLLAMAFGGTAQLFADENTVNLESKIVQDFSKTESQNWFVMGSKFSTKGFPQLAWAPYAPQALVGYGTDSKDMKSLGVAMLFDRQEYNWVDIIPGSKSSDGKWTPAELPLPGRIKAIDVWMWSGNYDYYVEVFVRDYKGIVHTLGMGDLNFVGWRNMRVLVPDSVPQSRKYLPKRESLDLVKFRIWTKPTEKVVIPTNDPRATDMDRAVKFYFNNIKVLTDTYESLYDGDNLSQPNVVQQVWGASGNK